MSYPGQMPTGQPGYSSQQYQYPNGQQQAPQQVYVQQHQQQAPPLHGHVQQQQHGLQVPQYQQYQQYTQQQPQQHQRPQHHQQHHQQPPPQQQQFQGYQHQGQMPQGHYAHLSTPAPSMNYVNVLANNNGQFSTFDNTFDPRQDQRPPSVSPAPSPYLAAQPYQVAPAQLQAITPTPPPAYSSPSPAPIPQQIPQFQVPQTGSRMMGQQDIMPVTTQQSHVSLQHPAPASLANESHQVQQSPSPAFAKSPLPTKRPSISAMNSPGISKRSPAIPPRPSPASSARASPAMTSKTRPFESATVLVHVAEECLSKAYSAVHSVAASPDEGRLREYQKLISTGLACLDAAVQTNKLAPRQEAKARLRYASILYEETENLQEAETTLFQGIKLCEKHRYTDLKYCMQYAALKVLFQRNHKAAFIAIDKQIAECQTFKHYPWLYAFRLLKTTLQTYAGNAPDATHFDNLQMLGNFAYERGDNAIGVLASLLEGLAHLRVMKSDSVERVQTCLAQAAMYQLDPAVKVPQLDILTLLLDLACSMHQKNPDTLVQKLSALESRLDETISSQDWTDDATEVCVPMKKQPSSSLIISEDTTAILRPGKDDEGTDLVVLSFLSKQELFALVHAFGGLANMYRPASREQVGKMKSLQRWAAGLETVQHVSTQHMLGNRAMATVSLHESIRQTKWRTEIFCYLQLLIGLYNATQSKWKLVDQSVSKLQKAATPAVNEIFTLFTLYLTGVYYQCTGEFETALTIYEDPRLQIPSGPDGPESRKPAELEVCILAAMSRLWILQDPGFQDEQTTNKLLESIQPLCTSHPDSEFRTAFSLVQVTTQPDLEMNIVKQNIQSALNGAQRTNNTHCLAIALTIMRCRLFENVVGEQALKSAKAASQQARRSGNLLWMSVADGMLANSYEVQGQLAEARAAQAAAQENASRAARAFE